MKKKPKNKAPRKRAGRKAALAVASGSALSYRWHFAIHKGGIWEPTETITPNDQLGIMGDFLELAMRAQKVSKRTGWPTRITFVCQPNT